MTAVVLQPQREIATGLSKQTDDKTTNWVQLDVGAKSIELCLISHCLGLCFLSSS